MLLDKYDTLVIDPIFKNIQYQFTESSIQIKEGLYFKINGPLTLVDKVYINGKFLDPSNYILKNGSTVLILAWYFLDNSSTILLCNSFTLSDFKVSSKDS